MLSELKAMMIILVGRNDDLEKGNAFRSADALRKQESRTTGDTISVVRMYVFQTLD